MAKTKRGAPTPKTREETSGDSSKPKGEPKVTAGKAGSGKQGSTAKAGGDKPGAEQKRESDPGAQSSDGGGSDSQPPKTQAEPRARQGARAFMAVGVFSAALIAVSLNVLVSRFYQRWDWTSDGLYTLSPATLQTLRGLDEPIDIVVFLARSDNMRVSVEHMLTAYGAETRQLRTRYVDPDQNPAEFLALQKQYDINPLTTDEGRVVSETALVIARGKKHWFVTADDMIGFDPEDGSAKPKLEQALTVGLRNVLGSETTRVCFTAGHQEPSLDSGAGDGMAELKYRIRHDNYEPELLDLSVPDWGKQLAQCSVVVSAPQVAMEKDDVDTLARWFEKGGNLLLLLNPVLAEDEPRIVPSGLEPLVNKAGITLGGNLLIEDSPKLKLTSTGEVFLVAPSRHDITLGLFSQRDDTTQPLVFKVAQSLGKTPDSGAEALANTSDTAYSLNDVSSFLAAKELPRKLEDSLSGPLAVALARELPKPAGSTAPHGPRMVVVGTASIALNDNWRAPALAPNAAFVTSALSWLAAKPALVDVPEKRSHDVGLNLTEESQSDVAYYVLLYMPSASVLIGGFVLYRRRAAERRSRRREDD